MNDFEKIFNESNKEFVKTYSQIYEHIREEQEALSENQIIIEAAAGGYWIPEFKLSEFYKETMHTFHDNDWSILREAIPEMERLEQKIFHKSFEHKSDNYKNKLLESYARTSLFTNTQQLRESNSTYKNRLDNNRKRLIENTSFIVLREDERFKDRLAQFLIDHIEAGNLDVDTAKTVQSLYMTNPQQAAAQYSNIITAFKNGLAPTEQATFEATLGGPARDQHEGGLRRFGGGLAKLASGVLGAVMMIPQALKFTAIFTPICVFAGPAAPVVAFILAIITVMLLNAVAKYAAEKLTAWLVPKIMAACKKAPFKFIRNIANNAPNALERFLTIVISALVTIVVMIAGGKMVAGGAGRLAAGIDAAKSSGGGIVNQGRSFTQGLFSRDAGRTGRDIFKTAMKPGEVSINPNTGNPLSLTDLPGVSRLTNIPGANNVIGGLNQMATAGGRSLAAGMGAANGMSNLATQDMNYRPNDNPMMNRYYSQLQNSSLYDFSDIYMRSKLNEGEKLDEGLIQKIKQIVEALKAKIGEIKQAWQQLLAAAKGESPEAAAEVENSGADEQSSSETNESATSEQSEENETEELT